MCLTGLSATAAHSGPGSAAPPAAAAYPASDYQQVFYLNFCQKYQKCPSNLLFSSCISGVAISLQIKRF
jgi:hypothetical protein